MPDPNGGTMTGREGDGFARITLNAVPGCESDAKAVTVTVQCTLSVSTSPSGSGFTASGGGTFNAGTSRTVTASTTNSNYVFAFWKNGSTVVSTSSSYTFTLSSNTSLVAYFAPLHIANATQWNEFSTVVNDGFNYSGRTVTLTADISVTTMAGTSKTNSFQGTFVGNCHTLTLNGGSYGTSGSATSTSNCAPFRYVAGATISDLTVAGNIYSSNQFAAGFIACAGHGNINITNCVSAVKIHASRSGDGTHGGFIGLLQGYNNQTMTATFTNCAFTGSITTSNGTTNVGGFVGWCEWRDDTSTDKGKCSLSLSNCLVAPGTTPSGESAITSGTKTYARCRNEANSLGTQSGTNYANMSNCYYVTAIGDAQAKQAYTFSAGSNTSAVRSDSPVSSYSCSTGLTAYSPGLAFDNGGTITNYAGDGDAIPLNLGYILPANNLFLSYETSAGSLSGSAGTGSNDAYTLTMSNSNAVITARFVNQVADDTWPHFVTSQPSGFDINNIDSPEDLAWLISKVNGLNGQTATTYSGSTINITADINMGAHTWVPIGTASHAFQGTFEGNGHVITGLTRSSDFPNMGLLGYVSGSATVRNVVVDVNFTGQGTTAGALIGTLAGGRVYNTGGTGTVTGGSGTSAMGGLVGSNSGTIHSSFAAATINGSGTNVGGIVGTIATNCNLYNAYSNSTINGGTNKGGLVGANGGTVENCYANGIVSGIYAFAATNSGTVQYCYANATGSGYVGTGSASGHGTFGAVQGIKHVDYMYRDNVVTLVSGQSNTYVSTTGYANNHTPKWNGMVSALNKWVTANPHSLSDLSSWFRPLTTAINGDLPVLGFPSDNSVAAVDGAPKALRYGSLNTLLSTYSSQTASIFLYKDATGVSNVPAANVHVYINEDAVLKQATAGTNNFVNTTVGITFDNSCGSALDSYGNTLYYDWHLMSTPLINAKIGTTYSQKDGSGNYIASGDAYSNVDIASMTDSYFPNSMPLALHTDPKWDFYCYDESTYHFINFKRNKNNHYHQVWLTPLTYNGADQATNDAGSANCVFIPGKGYMMAVSQNTFMNSNGTLNNSNVTLSLTNNGLGEECNPGANLVGNPYQAYLNLGAITSANSALTNFYIYDADQGWYAPVVAGSSDNPVIPSAYIHPHQAFFVVAPSGGASVTLTPSMAGTTNDGENSHFRDDDKVNYPVVNLFVENAIGQRDITVIEMNRPVQGGATKLNYLLSANHTVAAHLNDTTYGLLFTPVGVNRIPVRFKTEEAGTYKMTWQTYNGVFTELRLIDNMTGANHNMLTNDSYTFEASPDDYASRFYIVCTSYGMGIDEDDDDSGGYGNGSFAYISNGNIVVETGDGSPDQTSLQLVDVLGRVLYSTECRDGVHTISTHGLAKGVYVLRMTKNKTMRTQKIVVR